MYYSKYSVKVGNV